MQYSLHYWAYNKIKDYKCNKLENNNVEVKEKEVGYLDMF